jgi:cytochrome c
MKYNLFAVISVLFFVAACKPNTNSVNAPTKRDQTNVLLYTDKNTTSVEEQLQQAAAKAGWTIIKATDVAYFAEDSLKEISGIVLPFSAIQALDHRAITSLKRYLEAGGGGVVAIKDTVHTQNSWPWLQKWNEWQTGEQLKQDKGNVMALPATASAEELQKALVYTVGNNITPDYTKAATLPVPDASRYTYTVLAQGMDEPMEMAILPNNNVLIVERKGAVKLYDDKQKQLKTLALFDVFSGIEDGLLGVALDPNYATNHWVYFYYAVAGDKAINRLSRMELRGDSLIRASEKILLEVPMQRKYCCHSAGYLHFGPDGLLYLATGDNTNAEETEGYIPIDERPGRQLADDQATAANTNDLRGKILRIKPEPDGSYSIPEGNLFPKGTPGTRPEIYIMGSRNPYRFAVDKKNGYLYWGDIGPDTKVPASEGTLSYDEINQARKPGFYGWPYFLGENEAFPDYDYATKKEGPKFDPQQPINASPNNTGLRELPPAQKAMIWYGDGASKKFPLVGKGGQSLLAGPVYYSDLFSNAPFKLSPYYDGKLIIYDWVRRWFMAVTLDENHNYLRMEPFLDHLTFVAPTDIQFAADGSTYILEYGTNWFAKNSDAKLIRVEYAEGNRKPIADIQIDHLYGAAPLQTRLSAANSKDFDKDDQLHYQWQIEGKKLEGKEVAYTFTKPGAFDVQLTVTDNHGESNTATLQVKAGNAPPVVNIATSANRTFYWDNTKLDYTVEVSDLEDKTIDPSKVNVSLNFLPQGKDLAVVLTSGQAPQNLQYARGQYLVNTLDCKACHSLDKESVGPAYVAVSKRYAGKAGISDMLVNKIIKGGSGNWGQRPMSSHPDLPKEDAKEIVRYILSLTETNNSLPLQGTLTLDDHIGKGKEGSYLLMASYTDKGANGIEPLPARKYITLRNPLVQIEDFDEGTVRLGTMTTLFMTYATGIRHNSYVKFNQLDLTHVSGFTYRVQGHGAGGTIEVHLDKADGPLISSVTIPAGNIDDPKTGWKEVVAQVKEKVSGIHDVYFVFTNPNEQKKNLFNVDWIYFASKPAAAISSLPN